MTQKNINIIIILTLAVIVLFMGLGLFGMGGFSFGQDTPKSSVAAIPETAVQSVLDEIQSTGTVANLRAIDVLLGTGDSVVSGDTLTVNYIGALSDGTVFDASEAHGQPFTFTVGTGSVIQGWELGLLGMQEGGRRLLAIPPALGYGANAKGAIPANSTLLFEVELVSRVPAGAAQ